MLMFGLTALHILCMVVLIFELIYVLRQPASREQMLMVLLLIGTLYVTIFYTLEIHATEAQTAFLLARLAYIANPFLSLVILLFIMQFCQVKCPYPLRVGMLILQLGFCFCVLTNDWHHLYYKTMSFVAGPIFPSVEKEHGVMYLLYTFVILSHAMAALIICLRRLRKLSKPQRPAIYTLLVITFLPTFGFIFNLFNITGGYDTTIFCSCLACIVLLHAFFRKDMFGTLTLAKEVVMEEVPAGIVIIGSHQELLYENQAARDLALQAQPDCDLRKTIQTLVQEPGLHADGTRVLRSVRHDVLNRGVSRGTVCVLSDVTESYRYTEQLEKTVREKTHEVMEVQQGIISGVSELIEARDGTTGSHIHSIGFYVEKTLHALQRSGAYAEELTGDFCSDVIYAAPLHDIGKIAIPDAILCKPGALTANEYRVICTHARIGADLITRILQNLGENRYLKTAYDIALYHHERWDGGGYPEGLHGQEIPLSARVIAVCDVFEALVSHRCYKEALPPEQAFALMEKERGKHFDPLVLDAFLAERENILAWMHG